MPYFLRVSSWLRGGANVLKRAGSPTASFTMLGCGCEAASSGNRYDDPVVEAQDGSTKPRARQRGKERPVRPVEGEEPIASAPCECDLGQAHWCRTDSVSHYFFPNPWQQIEGDRKR